MQGNVWQWIEDCYHDSYQDAPIDGRAWLPQNRNEVRVLRGGSWGSLPDSLCSASRLGSFSDFRLVDYGFRVARTLTP
jgi:formylglycine-generating enzyme required for sulfatase activity